MSRNIVLITIDSLRSDHCGFLGSNLGVTPTLDELASKSIVYEYAIAPGPRTPSSMPVIFTGECFQPNNRGVYSNWEEKRTRWKERQDRIGRHMRRFRTLAERLRDRGYNTCGITANPWTTKRTRFHLGFQEFREIGNGTTETDHSLPIFGLLERHLGVDIENWLLTWPSYFPDIEELQRGLTEPYFLWIFLLDPHQPYITPRRYREETTAASMYYANARYNYAHSYTENLPKHLDSLLKKSYRDAVRSVDSFIDRIWSLVRDDAPNFIVHSDHGEAFQEHGTYGHRPQLYAENLRVPLIILDNESRHRVGSPISLRMLPDIICSLADGDPLNPNDYTSDFVRSETEERERVGVRGLTWSLLRSPVDWDYVHELESTELYYLRDDPAEQENIAEKYPEVTETLRHLLETYETDARERELLSSGVVDTLDETGI